MKMYQAAGRIYARYGLSAIGIPYQYGLVRATSASDLPEGMLNNSDRPDIIDPSSNNIINNTYKARTTQALIIKKTRIIPQKNFKIF